VNLAGGNRGKKLLKAIASPRDERVNLSCVRRELLLATELHE
jgi:hypothetical protein